MDPFGFGNARAAQAQARGGLTGSFRIDWKAPAVTRAIDAELGQRVYRAGKHVYSRIQHNINTSVVYTSNGIERSKPGEYPRRETGKLRNSIFVDFRRVVGGAVVYVGTDTDYAVHLEKSMNRSFILRTWREEQSVVNSILKRPMR